MKIIVQTGEVIRESRPAQEAPFISGYNFEGDVTSLTVKGSVTHLYVDGDVTFLTVGGQVLSLSVQNGDGKFKQAKS